MLLAAPRYAQSNAEAERAVQMAKNLLQKEDDRAKALLSYRSTPLQGGKSLSELLFSHQIRYTFPCIPAILQPSSPGIEDWRQEESKRKIKQKQHYDTQHRVKELHALQPSDHVWVQNESKPTTVKAQQPDQLRS